MPSAGTRPGHKRSIGGRCTQHRAPLLVEDAMQRVFIFAMAMWLGGLIAANAQTTPQASAPRIGQSLPQAGVAATTMDNSSSLTMPRQSGSTGATSSLEATPSAISATASDPLGVRTSTLPSAGQTTGSVAGAIGASPTINPQRAVQLPARLPTPLRRRRLLQRRRLAALPQARSPMRRAPPRSRPRPAQPALAACSARARFAAARSAIWPQLRLRPSWLRSSWQSVGSGSPRLRGEVGANGSRECAPDDRLRAG
jgi:hypothetical protein